MNSPQAETPSESGEQKTERAVRLRGLANVISAHPQWVAWGGFLLALLFLLMRLGFTDEGALTMWITSDSLYPVHVFTDVLQDGYPLAGWRFSIAPCWFPDLIATGLLWIVTQNVILATLLAGFMQIAIIVGAFRVIGKAIGVRKLYLQDTLLLGTGIAITMWVALHTATYYPGLRQFFMPQTHVGSMLSVLYGWGMALWIVRKQMEGSLPSRWFLIAYAALCLLAGMSNLLFLVHMLLPVFATLGILCFFGLIPLRGFLLPSVIAWIAAGIGALLNRVLFSVTDVALQAEPSLDGVLLAVDVFTRGFVEKTESGDLLHLTAIAWAVICAGVVVWFLRRIVLHGRASATISQMLLTAFFLISFLSGVLSIAAIVLGGSNGLTVFKDYVWTMHYMHQAFLFPLFGIPAAAAWVLTAVTAEKIARTAAWTCSIACLAGVLMVLLPSAWPAVPIYSYRPTLVRFIDELAESKGLRHGYAGYWQARLITLLSRTGVRAYAVHNTFAPFLWVSNEEWYRELIDERTKRPRVDFVVLDDPLWKLTREAAVSVLGEPVSELQVQDTRVLIYRKQN